MSYSHRFVGDYVQDLEMGDTVLSLGPGDFVNLKGEVLKNPTVTDLLDRGLLIEVPTEKAGK